MFMYICVKDFHDKFEIPARKTPGFIHDIAMKNRLDFQFEELMETAKAVGFKFSGYDFQPAYRTWKAPVERFDMDIEEVFDGILDQLYVLFGTAYMMGFGDILLDGFLRVHQANMLKEKVLGDWKIRKPAGWKKPYLGDLLGKKESKHDHAD